MASNSTIKFNFRSKALSTNMLKVQPIRKLFLRLVIYDTSYTWDCTICINLSLFLLGVHEVITYFFDEKLANIIFLSTETF